MLNRVHEKRATPARYWTAALVLGLGLALSGAAHNPVWAQDVPREVEELSDKLDVPFVASHEKVVETMLDLARVTKHDYVIDLGSGDGRINITAAKRFGARGFGVDLNEELVAIANNRAGEAGVADRARFYVRDIFKTDISQATVLTMYLLPDIVIKLRPRLLAALRPGARIVSHDYDMGAWRPDITRPVYSNWGSRSVVHFWIVPAQVAGTWAWTEAPAGAGSAARPVTVILRQNFQEVEGTATAAGAAHPLAGVRLNGDRLVFILTPAAGRSGPARRYDGIVKGDQIEGKLKILSPQGEVVRPWQARRVAQGSQGRPR